SLHDLAYLREREAKGRRDEETARLVCRDLPAFYKQVLSVSVHYREGENEVRDSLTGAEARAVVAALAAGKFEPLDWTEERWREELKGLDDRGAGEVGLTPGLGFDLPVVFSGEKEALIPGCGRLTFAV